MPMYVYKILETGATFEIQQSMREPALTAHPETGQEVRRMIQPVGISFKGSGFYVNDSRSNGSSKSSTSKESTGQNSTSKGASKTETKAEKSANTSEASKSTKTDTKTSAAKATSSAS